jgi:uncharacterized membrane protein YgcG
MVDLNRNSPAHERGSILAITLVVLFVVAMLTLPACTSNALSPAASASAPSTMQASSLPTATAGGVRSFPDPINGQAVYDVAGVLSPSVEVGAEAAIDAIEARTGAEIVVYLQVDPTATEESNTLAAGALIDQWGIGQAGINDGFVILVSFDHDLVHGKLSTYAGASLLEQLSLDAQARLRDNVMLPAFRAGNFEDGIIRGIQFVDRAIP